MLQSQVEQCHRNERKLQNENTRAFSLPRVTSESLGYPTFYEAWDGSNSMFGMVTTVYERENYDGDSS